MAKKIFFLVIILLAGGLIFLNKTWAGRLLPRFSRSRTTTNRRAVAGISVSVKFNSARNGIILSFNNLSRASLVSYSLSYQTNGKDEGALGTISPAGENSTSRELLFGTCSAGVCRYHTNITNARLEITTTLLSGVKTLKKYRIKI
ncbi:MAG: hypothetical protein QHH09_02035 [Microgenomates group bacterium]|jgi:hypothetical protein|nr:hypothetical protein [Microgenomates group bacterium]